MLKAAPTALPEVVVLEYEQNFDNRGCSFPVYSGRELEQAGIEADFAEESLYCPKYAGTLYGIHFQNEPVAQSKLLYCVKGSGLDYAIDLRKASKTYKQWVCVKLSAVNRKQIYIPKGFGHAFLSLEDDTSVVMMIDKYFDSRYRRAVAWNDPELNISFPIDSPILAKHDIEAPLLKESDCNL